MAQRMHGRFNQMSSEVVALMQSYLNTESELRQAEVAPQSECIGLSGVDVTAFRLGLHEAEAHADAEHVRRANALQAAAAEHHVRGPQ